MYKAVLLDISGVLYQDNAPLPGSVEAVSRLQQAGVGIRLVTNTSQRTSEAIYFDLRQKGFAIEREQLYTAPRAVLEYLKAHQLRPYCLIHPGIEPEFAPLDHSNPNAVVICDAGDRFDYKHLDKAFSILMDTEAEFLAVGLNRYFKTRGRLHLDAGPFVKALEYASGRQARIMGKPAESFFQQALQSLHLHSSEVLMVGDDVEADVLGAMRAGVEACLVRTGKYRSGDEALVPGCRLAPDLATLVDELLG